MEVFTRKSPGSAIKEVKIEASFSCSLHEIVAALEDIPSQKDWLMRTKDAYYILRDIPEQFSYYISTDMPFPVKDRDIKVEYKRSMDPQTGIVRIDYRDIKDDDKNQDHVRIPEMNAWYEIAENADGTLNIEYYLYIDAGGILPAWVVNLAITQGPTTTMQGLFDVIKSGKYKNAKVPGLG